MLDFLCEKIKRKLKKYNIEKIYEIRIRAGKNVSVNYCGDNVLLDVCATLSDVKEMVDRACLHSLYAYQKSISQGYITTQSGERIGLCGEFVYEKDKVICIDDISSLVIRIPHEIKGCSDRILKFLSGKENLLILSPPGMGKTTILRDLARQISNVFNKNVAIIDERGELTDKDNLFDIGSFTDKLRYVSKSDGIEFAIRNLKPDYIVLDELYSDEEFKAITYATSCGIKLICSVHANCPKDLKRKKGYKKYVDEGVFDYYVFIGDKVGIIDRVYCAKEFEYA